jgi:hypothetical protein
MHAANLSADISQPKYVGTNLIYTTFELDFGLMKLMTNVRVRIILVSKDEPVNIRSEVSPLSPSLCTLS